MPETKTKSSYSIYVSDSDIQRIDDSDDYSRSAAVQEALSEWIPENIEN